MERVLEGIKVIEFASYAAGPWCGRMLAEMGADVIKIEPVQGEPFRYFGDTINVPILPGENAVFQNENAGKKGICLDLRVPEGKQVLFGLLKDAHIFFTNTRMDALAKMGLTYEDLKEQFPKLIYGHISGYGLKGEDANAPGFDATAFWARSGNLLDMAFEGFGPCSLTYAVGDHITGGTMATGLLAALNKQTRTGEGEFVLVSLFGTAIGVSSLCIVPTQPAYGDHFPKSRYSPVTPICTTYICKDNSGGITLTLLDWVRYWPVFCKNVIFREDLIEDEHCTSEAVVRQPANSEFLVKLLTEIFLEHDREHWVALLKANDLPYSIAQHYADISNDAQAWDNGFISNVTFANGATRIIPSTPVQFKENKAVPCLPAPELGEHTDEVLVSLGYSATEISTLREKKIIN